MKLRFFNAILSAALSLTLASGWHLEATEVGEIFMKRHSGNAYDSECDVSLEQLFTLAEATRWTPSSYNDQPWSFIFCHRDHTPEAYQTVLDSLMGKQGEWVKNAPVLVVTLVRGNFAYNGKPNMWAEYDTGAAALSLSLQATELGLMTHQIGGFDAAKIGEGFSIPEGYRPLTVITVGYEAVTEEVPQKPQKPRERFPLEDNFFFGEWQHGLGAIFD